MVAATGSCDHCSQYVADCDQAICCGLFLLMSPERVQGRGPGRHHGHISRAGGCVRRPPATLHVMAVTRVNAALSHSAGVVHVAHGVASTCFQAGGKRASEANGCPATCSLQPDW